MSDEQNTAQEIRRLARMLAGISKTARDASLTGQLAGGRAVAVRQYNAVLARLQELGAASDVLFTRLPEDASFDEVGVAAMQLQEFLRDDEEEDPRRRWRVGGGLFEASPSHVKIVGLPGNIGEIGEVLREYLPEFIKQKMGTARDESDESEGVEAAPDAPEAPGAPAAPQAPIGSASPVPPAAPQAPAVPAEESRVEAVNRELQAVRLRMRGLTEQMTGNGMPPERQAEVAATLSQLAQRQAELASEKARLVS